MSKHKLIPYPVIAAAVRGMDRATLEYPVKPGLIFCLDRAFPYELNEIIAEKAITWRDLIVDVVVTPDGHPRVLDEDELPPDRDPDLAAAIDAARDDFLANHATILAAVERRTAALLP